MLCLDSNAEYVKVDSDSEINWDEDEDLGDAEIPGLISIFSQNLFINFSKKNFTNNSFSSSDSVAKQGWWKWVLELSSN